MEKKCCGRFLWVEIFQKISIETKFEKNLWNKISSNFFLYKRNIVKIFHRKEFRQKYLQKRNFVKILIETKFRQKFLILLLKFLFFFYYFYSFIKMRICLKFLKKQFRKSFYNKNFANILYAKEIVYNVLYRS